MKIENTSIRLKRIMKERNLRQVDILNLAKPYCEKFGVKLEKNDLSQYVSGKVEPKHDKVTILGLALDVNEAWLMGFEVPMEKEMPTTENSSGREKLEKALLSLGIDLENITDTDATKIAAIAKVALDK